MSEYEEVREVIDGAHLSKRSVQNVIRIVLDEIERRAEGGLLWMEEHENDYQVALRGVRRELGIERKE